jgi:surface protein
MADMFSGCSSLKELDLSGFDTAGVDYMGDLFSGCSSLESIDLSSFDTGSVTSMAGMFSGCMSLKTLDLSSFNTSAVTDMCMMFNRCSSLETLGLSNFDTSNVTNMRNMFDECTRLKTLDLSSFKTAGVTDMSNMFSDCRELKQLDLKSFDTGSVQYMSQMFSGCVTLSALNVSSFDTARVVGMDRMFFDCSSLKNLDLSSFATRSVSRMDSMFDGSGISSVVLGSGFSVWQDRAYLPAGTWTHSKSGKSLSEKELYSQYPSNTSSLAGTWSGKLQTVRVNELWMKVLGSSSIRTVMKTFVYALVYPDNATNKKVRWSSSSPSVASVDRYGIVTARKAGRTIITAVTEDGSYTGTFEIRVLFNDVPESGAYYSNPVYWAVDRGITNGYTDDDGLVRTFRPQNNCTREAVVTFLWRLAGKPMPKSTDSPFSDVPDKTKYYYNAVLWAAEKGITGGYSDGTFRPSATCLREHVVTFLWRYAGRPEVSMANSFTDISPSDYYYKAVLWAAKNNITKGYADDNYKTFRPKLDCLREHVVTFLYRYANLK